MRKIFLFCLLFTFAAASGQVYNNEWIDYNKTYYKFKIAQTGLYRISQATLSAAGLSSVPAEQFQLWRNGVQVPIYTSVATGGFSGSDYIEFWGEMNDGKVDRELYRKPEFHLNEKWSLISDTAVYFLTVNSNAAANLRLINTANNVAGNNLPAEPFFLYTAGNYFKDRINPGEAVRVGENLYSSSYDKGEGWSSADITTTYSGGSFMYGKNSFTFSNLFPYNGGPAAQFRIAVSGNTTMVNRRYVVRINGDSVMGNAVSSMNISTGAANVPFSSISTANTTVEVTNVTLCNNPPNCPSVDRMVIHQYELTYARRFNFGGASSFEFSLPASASNRYLEITGFNFGSTAPVLYDLTNGRRYVADISAAPQVRIVVQPSATEAKLVLVSEAPSNIQPVTALQTKNFINYSAPANRGNYLIISNQLLTGGGPTNAVEAYRSYRSSAAGGGYNAKVYDADELVDQFGFGIRKNPAGIRNFIRFARLNFPEKPAYVFIIGKAVNYTEQRRIEIRNIATELNDMNRLNLVPTFGYPASDILLASDPGSAVPQIAIGRLSAVSEQEVNVYLSKMQAYELAQKTFSPKLEDRNWMKNVVHIVGASDEGLDALLFQYLEANRLVIEDTIFGGKVSTFRKTSNQAGQQLSSNDLKKLFSDGISLITYFGHSSASTLDFNLDDPQNYNNPGKYPLFIGLGCNAGDFFRFSPTRLTQKETISEKFVLAEERGTIGFIASTHFGVVHLLEQWNTRAYDRISRLDYGNTIGEIMRKTVSDIYNPSSEELLPRANIEQTELHGDPALRINTHPKPDYIIEEQLVRTEPAFISVADPSFQVKVKMYNNGMALNRDIVVETKRQLGGNPALVLRRDTIKGIHYADSLVFSVPVNAETDKGLNKLIITVDADNVVDEIYESNNSVTKEVMVFEDEARPVYPYPFGIVNKQNIKLVASTADPFAPAKLYRMEMDTTELFNSPAKITREKTSPGGAIEFEPGINFTDSTVYYWRVAVVPSSGPINWNTSSFVFLPSSEVGFNQSHVFQHFKSSNIQLSIDSASQWKFQQKPTAISIRNGVFPTAASQATDFSIYVNGMDQIRSVCGLPNIIVNVFDPGTLQPWFNANEGQQGQFGSDVVCGPERAWNFQFSLMDANKRKSLVEFLERIPTGHYVIVRNVSGTDPANNFYASQWRTDTSHLGSNRSIYHHLYEQGFLTADSFNRPRAFIFTYRKDDQASFVPHAVFSEGIYDKIALNTEFALQENTGYLTSPAFGPAKAWKQLRWRGTSIESPSTDQARISVIGLRQNGSADTLIRNVDVSQQLIDLSSINAAQYPSIKLHLQASDNVNFSPYQLRWWRVTYMPVPEGALAPNLFFSTKDTFAVAEPLDFKIAFKNVSDGAFDSIKVNMVLTDNNNVQHQLPSFRLKPLPAGDTVHVRYPLDTRHYAGLNRLYLDVNPDNDQPEQYHFNNTAAFNFHVAPDTLNPLMDVTFDNVHILNYDIVSAKPNIVIRLTDESKWMITDPSTVQVQVRYPDGNLRSFNFTSDTLQFIAPAAIPGGDNTASVIFKPAFLEDGQYELIVSGKDMSNNMAGAMQYRVFFQVINKAMISNMLNYPNPFTTSTAFVFTLTGSEVPQNFKIQVLTVTGKVVREITKEELGPIHIGRNITEFKWDGTDQYGQKLANGVYLYRVVTSINGQSLEKYRDANDNTDKFFNKGYGKMYLMR